MSYKKPRVADATHHLPPTLLPRPLSKEQPNPENSEKEFGTSPATWRGIKSSPEILVSPSGSNGIEDARPEGAGKRKERSADALHLTSRSEASQSINSEAAQATSCAQSSDVKARISKSLLARRPLPKGVRNLGNTCYLSSVIRAVAAIHPLAVSLEKLGRKVQRKIVSRKKAEKPSFMPTPAFRAHPHWIPGARIFNATTDLILALVDETDAPKSSPVNPARLHSRVSEFCPIFLSLQQQDAHEFFLLLFDSIHEELRQLMKEFIIGSPRLGYPLESESEIQSWQLPTNLTRVEMEVVLTCTKCKHRRTRIEEQRAVALAIPDSNQESDVQLSLSDLLDFACQESLLDYRCDQDRCTSTQVRLSSLPARPPAILTLMIKRFAPDPTHRKTLKLTIPVDVPTELNIKRWLTNEVPCKCENLNPRDAEARGGCTCASYDLVAVVTHAGRTTESGHYVCIARMPPSCSTEGGGHWTVFNDSVAAHVGTDFPAEKVEAEGYIVFYVRRNLDAAK